MAKFLRKKIFLFLSFFLMIILMIIIPRPAKKENNSADDFYLFVSQKEKHSLPTKNNENSLFWLWIFLGIISFLIIAVILYFVFFKKNKNEYKDFYCGLKFYDDRIEIIFYPNWNIDFAFYSLWRLDVENKQETNEIYKIINKENNKKKIQNSFLLIVYLLDLITGSFLDDISQYLLNDQDSQNQPNLDPHNLPYKYKILSKLEQSFKKIKKQGYQKNNELIVLHSVKVDDKGIPLTNNDGDLFQDLQKKNSISFFRRIISNGEKFTDGKDVFFRFFRTLYRDIFEKLMDDLVELFQKYPKLKNKYPKLNNKIISLNKNANGILDKIDV